MEIWKGGADNADSFLDSVGRGTEIVYRLDPEFGEKLRSLFTKGKEFTGLAQDLAGADGAAKGAAIMAIVKIVINAYTNLLQRMAAASKSERDRLLSEARTRLLRGLVETNATWVKDIFTVPHISIAISGGVWMPGGTFKPAIFKPETKGNGTFDYRYLRPGPRRNPKGCSADSDPLGSVEGTDSASCDGQMAIYPLLYPCWRERSISTGGEILRASDKDDPGSLLVDLQMRAIFDPETNLNIPLGDLEDVVMGFERRFWSAVNKRKSPRRDPMGMVGPKPHGGWTSKQTAFRDRPGYPKAGLCGFLSGPGGTQPKDNDPQWMNGIQVLDKKPADPNLDQRFYRDGDGIIRALWSDEDLENCSVLSWGSIHSYDPDTGDRARCTIQARNAIWSAWLNITTARQFWGTRDYVRESWSRGEFSVDASALDVLEEKPGRMGKRMGRPPPPRGRVNDRMTRSGGGGAVVAVGAVAVITYLLRGRL